MSAVKKASRRKRRGAGLVSVGEGDPRSLSPTEYRRARRALTASDPVLAGIIARVGPCGLADAQRPDHFAAIARAICFQQLSTKAAATIYGRLEGLCGNGGLTPDGLVGLSDPELRGAGLSTMKVNYIRDLVRHVTEGLLPLDDLDAMTDSEVIRTLTAVKGIGRWSAEMFLMFRLHRPDVLPAGDLGIARAIRLAYGLRRDPPPVRILEVGEKWRPYRSVASWYLWASLRAPALPGAQPELEPDRPKGRPRRAPRPGNVF